MHDSELRRELQGLRERLDRLEVRLGLMPIESEPAHLQTTTAVSDAKLVDGVPTVGPAAVAAAEVMSPPVTPPVVAPPITSSPPAGSADGVGAMGPRFAQLHAQRGMEHERERLKSPGHSRSTMPDLEATIGGKWMAWVGALIVLFGVGFAIMVGVKHGWWGRMPAEWRCVGIALFGGMLLLGGEMALRRLGAAAAVGLFSAGLGTLYMDAFATFRFFHLLSSEWAFVLMGAVAVMGFALTLRTRFFTIGLLSLLGGYLTPLLLRGDTARDVELLAYLTMLFGIALGLSAVLPRPFRALRYFGIGAQVVVGGLWLVSNAGDGSGGLLGIFFASVWWVMVMGESIWAALRKQSPNGNAAAVMLATAAFVSAGSWILRFGPVATGFAPGTPAGAIPGLLVADWLGIFTVMTAALSAAAALHFGPALRELQQPRQAIDKLALALWAQAGVLLVLAIALQFRGYATTIGWFAVAMGAIEIGRRLQSRGVTRFALIVGALALVRVVLLDWWTTGGMTNTLIALGAVKISGWSLLGLGAIALTHVAAHRVWQPAERRTTLPIALSTIATLLWLGWCPSTMNGLAITAGWLGGAAVLLALAKFGRRQAYAEIGLGVAMLAGARWLAVDALAARVLSGGSIAEALPVLNAPMALAAGIALVLWWAGRVLRAQAPRDATERAVPVWDALVAAIGVFALLALSFEVDRAILRAGETAWLAAWPWPQRLGLALVMLWSAGGLALLRLGTLRRLAATRAMGFGIVAMNAVAWLSFGSIFMRVQHGPAATMVFLNLQFLAGAVAAGALAMAGLWIRGDLAANDERDREQARTNLGLCLALMALLGIVAGSLEIDRLLANEPMGRQAALSVFWAAYGVMLIVIGFARQAAPARYSGLTLLALVAAKVVFIDFGYLEDVTRVVSTLVAGLLFIGTSMLYFKLKPRGAGRGGDA